MKRNSPSKPNIAKTQRLSNYQQKLNLTLTERKQRQKDFLKFLEERNKPTEIETNKIKVGNFTFLKSKTKEIAYSRLAREIIRETPGLLKEFYKVSTEKLNKYTDPEGRFEIKRHLLFPSVRTTNTSYVISVKHNGKTKKFFIKEINNSGILERSVGNKKTISYLESLKKGIDGISEAKALSVLDNLGIGIKTIKRHFAFKDDTRKLSYIVYDFNQDLFSGQHLRKMYLRGNISKSRYLEIMNRLAEVKQQANNELDRNRKRYGIEDNRSISDFLDDNVYYDTRTKEFYVFDLTLESDYERKY